MYVYIRIKKTNNEIENFLIYIPNFKDYQVFIEILKIIHQQLDHITTHLDQDILSLLESKQIAIIDYLSNIHNYINGAYEVLHHKYEYFNFSINEV